MSKAYTTVKFELDRVQYTVDCLFVHGDWDVGETDYVDDFKIMEPTMIGDEFNALNEDFRFHERMVEACKAVKGRYV